MHKWHASYYDGENATRHAARISTHHWGLLIRLDDTGHELTWSYDQLRSAGGSVHATDYRVSHVEWPDARLVFDDDEAYAYLVGKAPHLRSRRRRNLRHVGLVVGAATAAIAAYFFLWPLAAEHIALSIPKKWERGLGQSYLNSLEQFSEQCDKETGAAALSKMTERLLEDAALEKNIDVRVVDSGMINAVALPGGYVVIFDGLIQDAESAEEVAGVLAHEIGHQVENHSMTAFVRDLGLSLIVGSIAGDVGYYASALSSLSYTREAEAEADRLAGEILGAAHVDPDGFARFFERLSEEKDNKQVDQRWFSYISTHPPLEERAARVRAEIDESIVYRSVLEETEWEALRSICGDKPEPDETDNEEAAKEANPVAQEQTDD